MSRAAVSVCYVGGLGRSGSTLLGRLLGELQGWCFAGEITHVWQRGLTDNELCSCGARFRECPFWARVGDEAFGGWASVDARAIAALRRRVDRARFLPLMLRPGRPTGYQWRLASYATCLGRLYQAIGHVSGCRVVIDTSKHPSYGFLLRHVPGIDLTVVHLVRDSRAVAYSWTRRVRRPEITGSERYMARFHPGRVAVRWVAQNGLLQLLASGAGRSVRLTYEDLVHDPRNALQAIAHVAGENSGEADLSFLADGAATLGSSHAIGGNPMRFEHGPVRMALDQAWTTEMASSHRLLVSCLTAPSLRAYGYSVRARPPRRL